jgi:hypothetical protein
MRPYCVLTLIVLPLAAVHGSAADLPPIAREVPAQRLNSPRGPVERFNSDHFEVSYDPQKLTRQQAEEAREHAERAWAHCAKLFQRTLPGRIRLDLTPDFAGATGFANPGEPDSRDPEKRPLVGVRYADLDYLGLSAEYVVTHEVAHVFSGDLASGALGEGIADWGAGGFAGVAMRPWWGAALRNAGLWIDPDAFFITGAFPSTPEVNAMIRTARYVESGLLVLFLINRFGWTKFQAFAPDYAKARGRLSSNEDLPPPGGRQGRRRENEGEKAPDAAAVMACFTRHFGVDWRTLRSEWEAGMVAEPAPVPEATRLILAQQIYGAIRNYEMWVLEQRSKVPLSSQQVVRDAFREANRLLKDGQFEAARRALARAGGMVERLRRPVTVTHG